jgi:hypothetical protein
MPLPPPILIQAPPPPPPAWAALGAPRLTGFETISYGRYGVIYVEVTYFVDAGALRRRKDLKDGAQALRALREGQVWCATRVHFLEGSSRAKRQEFTLANLKAYWPGADFSPHRPDVRAYVDFAARLIDMNDTVTYLFPPRGELVVTYKGEAPKRFTLPSVAAAVRAFEWSDQAGNPEAQARLRAALERLLKAP